MALLIILAFISALILTYAQIPTIVAISKEKKLVDIPDERRVHKNVVPNLGGIAIFIAVVVVFYLTSYFIGGAVNNVYILISLIILFMIGLKDDIIGITATKKFGLQTLAALVIVLFGQVKLTNLHGFAGLESIPVEFSVPVSIFLFLLAINSMNLIDGVDGLASGIGIVASTSFGIWFAVSGEYQMALLSFVLSGALVGFWIMNVFGKQNKIFMGDTGSMILGFLLGYIAIVFCQTNIDVSQAYHLASAPAVAIGILIVPLYDTLRVFTIRLSNGKSPFEADKNHIHHRLLMLGLSHLQISLWIVGVNVFIAAFNFILAYSGIGIITLLLVNITFAFVVSLIPHRLILYRKIEIPNDKNTQIVVVEKDIIRNFSRRVLQNINNF